MNEIFHVAGWSAPTAIGIAGLGGGFEVGAEVCFAQLFDIWSAKNIILTLNVLSSTKNLLKQDAL